jgi:uncharacterized membrane protein
MEIHHNSLEDPARIIHQLGRQLAEINTCSPVNFTAVGVGTAGLIGAVVGGVFLGHGPKGAALGAAITMLSTMATLAITNRR